MFFLYPTSFLDKDFQSGWNARIDDEIINRKTDQTAVLYQASIFNSAGRVFAPRYRQANYYCYFTHDTAAALAAFDLAYTDIKAAFQYYLDHYNNGRPIIIASHSQGTTRKTIDARIFRWQTLTKQLVAAYLAGMPVQPDWFSDIPACTSPGQTGCFCSWRTFKKGYTDSFVQKNNILRWSPTRLPGTAASLMQTVSPIEAPCYTSSKRLSLKLPVQKSTRAFCGPQNLASLAVFIENNKLPYC